MNHMKNTAFDYYSVVLIPPGNRTSYTLQIRKQTLKMIGLTIAGCLAVLSLSLFINVNTKFQKENFKKLKLQTLSQQKQIEMQNDNLDDLEKELRQLIEKEEEIRIILGENKLHKKSFKDMIYNKSKEKSKRFNATYKTIRSQAPTPEKAVTAKTFYLKGTATDTHRQFTVLLNKAKAFKIRFAHTPSIRPLQGRLESGFGMRNHPILGTFKEHNGIDISSWRGAPIQAAAEGVVQSAGWSGTYGFVVVLNHSYGYTTIYGHCSKLLVSEGARVKKGQVIAQVGATGMATGPHLHYEVRRWKDPVNPVTYLDLDMFTASQKIW